MTWYRVSIDFTKHQESLVPLILDMIIWSGNTRSRPITKLPTEKLPNLNCLPYQIAYFTESHNKISPTEKSSALLGTRRVHLPKSSPTPSSSTLG